MQNKQNWAGCVSRPMRDAHTRGWKAPVPGGGTRAKPVEQLGESSGGTSSVVSADAARFATSVEK